MRVTSKRQFFEMWRQGVLGNRTQLWDDPQEAYNSGVPEIGFREIGKAGGGAWEKTPREQLFATAEQWKNRRFMLDDGAPDEKRTLQGEICRGLRGLEGYLEVGGQLPMRKAMAAGLMQHCSYVVVLDLLHRYMDPSSQDDLWDLLDLFPDATVEFSCFTVDVGVFPGRNTLFWETRDY